MKIDLSKAKIGDEFELRGGNVAIFVGYDGRGEFPYSCTIDEQLCSYKQDGSYISATEHALDIIKALNISEQEVDPVQEVLDMIITTIEEASKSSKVLFDLVKFNTSRIESLENKIDILMSERNHEPTSIEDNVCSKIQERKALGLEKYGTTMERTDLSIDEWLTHAQEESMDFSIYLEKIIAIRKADKK